MIDTPQKNLLDFDITPQKAIVQTDINGWMETNKKHETPKIRIKKKFPPKSNTSNIQTTIDSLKKRREQLMKSSSKKNQFLLSGGTTQPGTSEEEKQKSALRGTTQWYKKLPLVHVNEFVAEQKDEFQKHTLVQPCKGLSLTDQRKNTIRRHSLQKLKKFQKEKNELKQNVSIVNNSSQILQQKVSKDQYTGLATLSRKTINILLKLRK